MINIIKKIVYSLCLLYAINVIISSTGKIVPINIYTITFVSVFDIVGILGIVFLKYYL